MYPPVKETLRQSADVRALLGDSPRVFRNGQAPQNEVRPYVVWLVMAGVPLNNLSDTPPADNDSIQIDCYSKTDSECEALAKAVRNQMETVAHMTAWRTHPREESTLLYHVSLDFDYWLAHSW